MTDLPKLASWRDPAITSALSWYLDVAENRRPAKFRIAATVATQVDLGASSEHALWSELNRLTPVFGARWRAIRVGGPRPNAVRCVGAWGRPLSNDRFFLRSRRGSISAVEIFDERGLRGPTNRGRIAD